MEDGPEDLEPRIANTLFGIFNTRNVLRIDQLDIDEDLANELLALADRRLASMSNLVEIPYDPTYRSLQGEYMRLGPSSSSAVQDAIEIMEAGPHDAFSITGRGNLSGIRYYAFKVVRRDRSQWCFGRVNKSMVLGRKRLLSLLVDDGTKLKAVDHDVIQLGQHVDYLTDNGEGYVFHVQNFHYIFDFYRRLREKTERNVQALAEKVPIDNIDDFAEACSQQAAMALKLHHIVSSPGWETFPLERMYDLIQEENLPIEVKEEEGMRSLVFDPDLRHRWLILRLIGDDILKSPVTERIFEATSKKDLPA